mgnify:CR=1 FL=1
MRKVIICLILVLSSFVAEARVKSYNIDKKEVVKLVVEVNKLVFEEDLEKWNEVMFGTLSAETDMGAFKGSSKHGIAQITPVAFKFIKKNILKDEKLYNKLKAEGIDFKKIRFNNLTHNHKASVVAMSLYYKYVMQTKKISIKGKTPAQVWKIFYNTSAGAGTLNHFNKAYSRNKEVIEIAMNEIHENERRELKDMLYVKEVKEVGDKLVMVNPREKDIEVKTNKFIKFFDTKKVIENEINTLLGMAKLMDNLKHNNKYVKNYIY